MKYLVRKGGFEPPRLSAPPPQDGVSASSTTSARQQPLYYQFIVTATSSFQRFQRVRFCVRFTQHTLQASFPLDFAERRIAESFDPLRRLDGLFSLIHSPERPAYRLRPRVDITHRSLDGVVPGDVLQRKSVRM